jgi:outer membrane protein OmpA-like peptidoglycan-associated protein
MKKLLTFIALFIGTISFAQYSKSSIEPSFGITKIQDVTPFRMFNSQLGYRHMFNTKFGARILGGYSRLYESYEYQPYQEPLSYNTGTLHGVVNVGRVLGFESFTKHYTILGSIGGTYTYSDGSTNNQIYHRYSNFHLSARIDNEIKITKGIFANASLDFIKDVNNRPFVPSTETTNIFNINIGVVISLNHSKEHADWYIEPKVVDTILLKPTIIDNTITNNITKDCNCKKNEYVFFNHDSYIVDKDGLNAIVKIADELIGNGELFIIGYASPPGTDDYNRELSKKRVLSVVDKLISLGIKGEQLNLEFRGEQNTLNSKNVDLSRRVELLIK